MIQFIIVMSIVGGFTAYFFGVPASLKVGRDLTDLWITAGLAVIFLGPLLGLAQFVHQFFRRIAGLVRR